MTLRIPEEHKKQFLALLALDSDKREKLVAAAEREKAHLNVDELSQALCRASGLTPHACLAIVRVLLHMYRASKTADAEHFSESVLEAIRDSAPDRLRTSVDWDGFLGQIRRLLKCDTSLGVTAKVGELRSEYGKVYCSARILSDIRPVFGDNESSAPLAGAIVHVLRVTYHEEGSHKNVHIALDANDLCALGDLVRRAQAKEVSLRREVEKTSMQFIDAEQH